jgi:hypothetical protein
MSLEDGNNEYIWSKKQARVVAAYFEVDAILCLMYPEISQEREEEFMQNFN